MFYYISDTTLEQGRVQGAKSPAGVWGVPSFSSPLSPPQAARKDIEIFL